MADRSLHARRPIRRGPFVAASAFLFVVASIGGALTATGQTATAPPNTFSVRLEGYAVETNTFSTATAVTPRSAYSFAKVGSVRGFDGGRDLDMEARGANDQYAGLEGAVIFDGGTPTDGNNLPGYTQAFFPTFEGFSEISEKCATNQTEAREAPECRDQDGPYALAKVVPDEASPAAVGIGRNQGDEESGDARSHSLVQPQPDGSVSGFQSNSGSDQGVPGTPIVVESYLAEQTVTTSLEGTATEILCEGEVTVGGQPIGDDEELQQALAPLTVASDLRVQYEPATEPEILELAGGALQASCRGPRFTVFNGAQGGTGTTYTFGWTFAAVGVTDNREGLPTGGGGGGGTFAPIAPAPVNDAPTEDTGFVPSPVSESSSDPSPSSDVVVPTPTSEPSPTSTVPVSNDEEFSSNLVRESIDAMPIALGTGLAAALLPLGVWMLLGVTGSLARGLPTLSLPPFRD